MRARSPNAKEDENLRYVKALFIVVMVTAVIVPSVSTAASLHPDCRNYSPEKTVRCAAIKQDPPGGVLKALSVWRCESGFGDEGYHTDPYHGPFQYMSSTYTGQWLRMDDVQYWFRTVPDVHDVRSNIITAVAWAARYGWGPWSCA